MSGVLLKRFRLNPEALEGHQVAYMDFPYWTALNDFLDAMKRCRPSGKISYKELPPWSQLNSALLALAPMLVQGFERNGKGNLRRMLALVDDGSGASVWRPPIDLIRDLLLEWIDLWVVGVFADERKTSPGAGALRKLIGSIQSEPETDWQLLDLKKAWDAKDGLMWRSTPALLASMLVLRQKRHPLELSSGDDIHWQLAQDGDRLVVIGEPVEWHHVKPSKNDDFRELTGLYSHKLEITVQTIPGDSLPWIYIHHRVRRYVSRKVSRLNKADVSILAQIAEARHLGWQASPTFVRLRVFGTAKNPQYRWGVNDLLGRYHARRLTEPRAILGNPQKYAEPDELLDRYLVVYAEGLRPIHPMKTGIGMVEQAEVIEGVLHQMQGVLVPDSQCSVDPVSRLTPRDIGKQRGTIEHLELATQDRLEELALGHEDYQPLVRDKALQALMRASGDRPIQLLLLGWSSHSLHAMRHYVNRTLYMDPDESTEGVRVESHVLESELGIPEKWTKLAPQPSKNNLRAALDPHVRSWIDYIRSLTDPNSLALALIELPSSADDRLQSYFHYVIRRACAENGVLSQMLKPIPSTFDPTDVIPPSINTAVRIKNACRDLLVRQPHVVYSSLAPLYQRMGIPENIAQKLTIIGLYRYRSDKPRVDYPLAVRMNPEGRTEVCVPNPRSGQPSRWMPYTAVPHELVEHMRHPSTRSLRKKSDTSRLNTFVRRLLDSLPQTPTLVLLEADGWRSDVLAIADREVATDQLDIKYQRGTWITAKTIPGLRIVRLRDTGTINETPQWVASEAPKWDKAHLDAHDLNEACLLAARPGSIPVFYSIGRTSRMAHDPEANQEFLSNSGGDVAFRHQQAVEIVPFFLQPEDEPAAWARVVHALRFSTAWGQGNLSKPYPLHLAHTLLEDMKAAVPPYDVASDEESDMI